MTSDERAIRDLIATWMSASKAGDSTTVLALMTDDAIFMVAGQAPFGKDAFAAASRAMANVHIDDSNDVLEVQIEGNLAFARSRINMTVTPPNDRPIHRTGYAMTIFRKGPDGAWRLSRDANLMSVIP